MNAAVPSAALPLPLLPLVLPVPAPVPVPPPLNRLRKRSLFEVGLDAAGDVISVLLLRAQCSYSELCASVLSLQRVVLPCFGDGWMKGCMSCPFSLALPALLARPVRPSSHPRALPSAHRPHRIVDAVLLQWTWAAR